MDNHPQKPHHSFSNCNFSSDSFKLAPCTLREAERRIQAETDGDSGGTLSFTDVVVQLL